MTGCMFESCLVFGLQLAEPEFPSCKFTECKGMLLIDPSFEKFEFNREKLEFPPKKQLLWRQEMLLVHKRAWSKEDTRRSILRDLQGAASYVRK